MLQLSSTIITVEYKYVSTHELACLHASVLVSVRLRGTAFALSRPRVVS